jgi:hypothetical protein
MLPVIPTIEMLPPVNIKDYYKARDQGPPPIYTSELQEIEAWLQQQSKYVSGHFTRPNFHQTAEAQQWYYLWGGLPALGLGATTILDWASFGAIGISNTDDAQIGKQNPIRNVATPPYSPDPLRTGYYVAKVGPRQWKALATFVDTNKYGYGPNWGYCNMQAAYLCNIIMNKIRSGDPLFAGMQVRQVYFPGAGGRGHSAVQVQLRNGKIIDLDPWQSGSMNTVKISDPPLYSRWSP